jgi:hypothetical protein
VNEVHTRNYKEFTLRHTGSHCAFFFGVSVFSLAAFAADQPKTTIDSATHGQPVQSVTFPAARSTTDVIRGSDLFSFGDSLTVCYGVTPPSGQPGSPCWVDRFARVKTWTFTNDGQNGTGINDPGMFGEIVPLIQPASNIKSFTLLCCVNDMRDNLTPPEQATWANGVEAALWWLATPEANKVRSSSGAVTYAGSWSLPPDSYSGNMNSTASNGATASFSVYGTDVVVIPGWQQVNSSTYSITVDGTTFPTQNTDAGAYVSIAMNTNYGPGFFHLAGLAAQTHTVVYTCISASDGNPCYFIAGGTSYASYGASLARSLIVYYGETARLTADGYNLTTLPNCPLAPCGSPALTEIFDRLGRFVVADLANVGLNVVFVAVNAFYTPNSKNTQSDGVHPTAAGDKLIARAFLNAEKGSH